MKKITKIIFLRWLFSILLIAFWGIGTVLAQDSNRYPDPNDKAAMAEEMEILLHQSDRFVESNSSGVRGCMTSLDEGFEETFPPAGWTIINGGDVNTWSWYSGLPHTGTYMAGIEFNSDAHNDWLITPQIQPEVGNAEISFWALNYSSSYPEKFNVMLSTTGTDEADFTVTLAANVTPPADAYQQYTYDLTAYNGQPVYVAVQAISTDEYYLFLDDFLGPNIVYPTTPYFNGGSLVDFGTTYDLGVYEETYEISNCGTADDLTVSLDASSPELTFAGLPATIPPGGSATVTVTFTPGAGNTGSYTGSFDLTTNDPGNQTVSVGVVSDVEEAVITTNLFEDFETLSSYSRPDNWEGNFSVRTSGGTDDSRRFTRNLYGTSSFMTGQFTTNFTVLPTNSKFVFDYRAVDYTGYPTTPTPADQFKFTVYISTDYGVTYTPIYTCDETTHVETLAYAGVEIDLAQYIGKTVFFAVDAELVDGNNAGTDMNLDFDNFGVLAGDPGLVINNPALDMGDRPIGAWMKPASYEIVNNPPSGDFLISQADIDNNYDGFLTVTTPETMPFPLNVGDETTDFGIATTEEVVTDGAFAGNFAVFYGDARAIAHATYSGNAYTPVDGDVWEKAFDGNAATYPVNVPMGTFRDNYDLPGVFPNGRDVVYKYTFTTDVVFSSTLTAADAKMALYPVGFGGVGGPDMENELFEGTPDLIDIELTAGTYYLVVSTTGDVYDLNVTFPDMPAPDAATYVAPVDGATGIVNGNSLKWTFGDYTVKYQVMLGITYPPTTVVVDWTDDLAEAYTLINTQPNLQYFWQVNTGNSNDTTYGDVRVFTTTITPPSGLEVTLNDPGENISTVSTSLVWDAPATKAFLGYNVYRDGVKINDELLDVESYADPDLARDASYKYFVTSVYDQGESRPSNDTTVIALGVGTFDGVVTNVLNDTVLPGVSVNIFGDDYNYTLTTDADGEYSTLAYTGTYDITASYDGFNTASVTDVVLTHGATETNDFALTETPLPVGDVVAEEISDDQVLISWGDAAIPPITEWLAHDDGVNYSALGYTGGEPMTVASRWTPAMLVDVAGTSLTKLNIFLNDDISATSEVELHVWTGTLPEPTLIYTQTVAGDIVPGAWNEFTLDTPVDVVGDVELWFGYTVSDYEIGGHPCGFDEGPAVADYGDLLYFNGVWTSMASYGIGNWNLQGFVTDAVTNMSRPLASVENSCYYDVINKLRGTTLEIEVSDVVNTSASASLPAHINGNTRGVVSYDIYRNKVYQPETAVLVGNTNQQSFVDFDWSDQTWGVYEWSVVVNYDENQVSEPTYSNTLEKDMEILVSATATTNSGDSPMGTLVTFTNTSELDEAGDPIYIFEATLDDTGFKSWDDFRRGTYDIEVLLPGFTPVDTTGVDIFEDEDFEWMLEEIIASPVSLHVTPTGFATWNGNSGGGGGSFEPFLETFDGLAIGELPVGWTQSEDGNWGATNDHYAGGSAPEMRFYWGPNYGTADEYYLKTPVISTEGQTTLEFSFKHIIDDYSAGDSYSLRVVTIADGVEHIIDEWVDPADIGPEDLTYTLTDADGVGAAEFQLAFVFDGDPFDVMYWDIDNVMLNGPRGSKKMASRAFETYKVFLDSAFITEVGDNEYQYGTNGEVLVKDSTYKAGVAAVYTTGQSATAEFDWVYIPCDEYDAPTAFTAAQVEGTLNILLEWTNVDAAALDTIDGVRIYRDGEEYDFVDFSDGVVNTFTDGPLEFGTYNYCITYIYESGAETCQGVVCSGDVELTGNATVDGFVKQEAYLGGAPIEGAEVQLVNVDSTDIVFTFNADSTGAYGGTILAGTYDYEVSARGYITDTLDDVEVPYGATVTNNFELDEFPLSPVDVTATEITDDEVLISWHSPVIPFEPASYDFEDGPDDWEIQGNVNGWQWGDNATLSSSFMSFDGNTTNFIAVNADAAGSGGSPIVVNATSPSQFFASASEVFVKFDYILIGTYGDALAVYYSVDGGTPVLIENLPSSTSWTNNYIVEVPAAALQASVQIIFKYSEGSTWGYGAAVDNVVITDAVTRSGEPVRAMTGYEIYRTTCETGDLQLMGAIPATDSIFNDHTWGAVEPGVYKWGVIAKYETNNSEIAFSNCLDKNMITDVTVTVTTDDGGNAAGTVVEFTNVSEPDLGLTYTVLLDETGYYAWDEFRLGDYDIHVEKAGFAPIDIVGEPIWEATDFEWLLEEEILPVADLHVTPTALATWTGVAVPTPPPPPGPTIIFEENFDSYTVGDFVGVVSPYFTTWSNNPGSSEDSYITDLQSSSPANSVNVELNDDLIVIMDDYTTGVYTYEMKMYVPTGYAGYFNLQATSTPGDGYGIQVYYQTDGMANGDAGVADAINHPFDHDVWNDIKVVVDLDNDLATYYFNGTEIIEYQWTLGCFGGTQTIPLSFGGADIFGGVESGSTDTPMFYIDDVVLSTPPETTAASRSLENYKVWLDGIFVENTMDNFYQYDISTLVPNQEYYTEVAAQYTNGTSEKMDYTWTYMPCDSFPGPTNLAGELQDVNNVLLTWSADGSNPPPPPGGFSDDFESYADFLIDFPPWTNVDVDGSTTYGMNGVDWPNSYAEQSFIVFNPSTTTPAITDMTPHSGDKFVACMAATTAPNNDWLITPSVTIANGNTVSFWAKSYIADYGLERFKVGVSTTLDPNDFTIISPGAYVEAPAEDWTEFSYDLSAYAGQDVYVGIQCVSNDAFIFMLDDFAIGSAKASNFAFNPSSPVTGHGTKVIGESNIDVDAYMAELAALAYDRADTYVDALPSTSVAKPLSSDRALLYDNGPLVNSAGTGVGGADESILMDGLTSYGSNCNKASGYSMADDFVVDADWTVESFVFYAYQTNGGIPSTITAGYFQIYDGDPSAGGSVIYGDLTTNVMTSTQWSNIYRNNDGPGGSTNRAIMEIECAATGLTLTPGTYWVEFTCEGSAASGPWAPPITISGQTTTGNGLQWTGTAWQAFVSGDGDFPQGVPFLINGTTGGGGGGGYDPGPVLGANVYRDGVMIADMVQDTFYLDTALNYGMYEYCVNLVYGEGAQSCSESCVDVEVTEDCVAPEDLTATLEGDNLVHLLWDQTTPPVTEWISYNDGTFENAFCSTSGGQGLAQVFTPTEYPCTITEVRYFNDSYGSPTQENEVYVLTGDGATVLAGPYSVSGEPGDTWVTVDVEDVTIESGTFMVFTANVLANGPFVGVDDSFYDGSLYFGAVGAFDELGTFGYYYVGSHEANVIYGDLSANPAPNSTVLRPANANNSISALSVSNHVSSKVDRPVDNKQTRSFVGYNIYHNGDLLEALWPDNYYDYEEMLSAHHCYTVTAEYSYCGESDPSNEACVDITVGIDENDGSVNIYPNPATDELNIKLSNDIKEIKVYNYVGQVVYGRNVTSSDSEIKLNTSNYYPGTYLIQFITEYGKTITKKVVIIR